MRWRDHAVLYRTNAQSGQFEFALKRSGIPYRVIGGARFFDRTEVRDDVLSGSVLLQILMDEITSSRIINTPARGIGEKSVETARAIARDQALSLFEVLEHADFYPSLSRASVRMREFARMIRELQDEQLTSDALYDRVLEKTGYITMLEQSRDERDESRVDNVHELKSSILAYQNESGDTSLPGYLASIALYTDVRSIGEQDEMEEERRLCYVAFTRAKKRLVVSYARQRMLYGKTTANRPSRFLEESGLAPEEPQPHSASFSVSRMRAVESGWLFSPPFSKSRSGATVTVVKAQHLKPLPNRITPGIPGRSTGTSQRLR